MDIEKLRLAINRALFLIFCFIIRTWYFIFSDYYSRLVVQAQYLYRQSDLFKMRWQEMGLDYAEESFEGEIARYFLHKAKKEPFVIKWRHFKDSLMNRPAQPYFLQDD